MSEIIERRREVADVVRLWKGICRGETRITFREFYGIPGIGKTELAKQIRKALEKEGALCACLDFDPIQNPWGNEPRNERVRLYYEQPEYFFRDLLREWNYLDTPDLQAILSSHSTDSTFEPLQFVQQVVDRVKALSPDKTVALICDETDHIDWERLSWFERDLIAPLIKGGHCLIVWLGRLEKQWPAELASIKEKTESSSLDLFSLDEVDELLKLGRMSTDNEKDNLLIWLYDITKGHPMATEVVIQHYSGSNSTEEGLPPKIEVVEDITERVIKGYILRNNPLQYSEVLNLSLLRINDVSLLKALVGEPSDSVLSYGKLAHALRANPIGDFGERLLKKPLAIWLNYYFRISNPEGYLNKQEALLQECMRLCGVGGRHLGWPRYVVESVYHAACANSVDAERRDLSGMLRQHLQNLSLPDLIGDPESLIIELEESFRNDREIEEYIGKDGVDQLVAVLEDVKNRL